MFHTHFRTLTIETPPGVWERLVGVLRGAEPEPRLVVVPAPEQLLGREFPRIVDRTAALAEFFDHPVIL